MPIDFTNKPGVSSQGSAIPEWLSPIVSGSEKKASNDQKMTKEASTEITKEMIEDMLLSNDRITRLQKGASVEKKALYPRMDAAITPYSQKAQEKLASHWGGDSSSDIRGAEGDVVNDGDKVRDAEKNKFEGEAKHTESRLDREHNVDRNSLWEVADQLTEDDSIKKSAGSMPAAAMKALQDFRKGKKSGKKDDKKDDKKDTKKDDKKDDKKDAKKDDKKEDKKDDKKKGKIPPQFLSHIKEKKAEVSEDELMRRYYSRHKILDKYAAKKPSDDYGSEAKSVQFGDDWYNEIIGEKTNIGNVNYGGKEKKKASVDVGLDFDSDPKADGTIGDFKMKDIFDENNLTREVGNDYGGDDKNYSSELGDTHSNKGSISKAAHYNNRTQNLSDDGPTAPAKQDDGRDTSEQAWWKAQADMSEKFYNKEQSILGGGKKETHMDAIPVFDGATKTAFVNTRKLKRESILSKVAAAQKAVSNEKSYYAEAYGDAGYAALQIKDPSGMNKKASDSLSEQFDTSTVEGRAARRRVLAGIDVPFAKIASDESLDKEAGIFGDTAPGAVGDLMDKAVGFGKQVGTNFLSNLPANIKNALEKNPEAVSKIQNFMSTHPELKDIVLSLLQKDVAPGDETPDEVTPQEAEEVVEQATKQAMNIYVGMRKEARKQIYASSSYGEPVKETYGNVGDADWDSSALTRNAIVDSPQDDIIGQLAKSIDSVRDAIK